MKFCFPFLFLLKAKVTIIHFFLSQILVFFLGCFLRHFFSSLKLKYGVVDDLLLYVFCFLSLSLFFSIIHRSFSYCGWSSTTVTTSWIWIRFRNSRTIHAATWSGQPRTRSWNTGHGPGNSGCSPSSGGCGPGIWSFNRFCWGP